VPVHGIELSRAMVARLRAKPGGDAIGVTVGDFATTRVDRTFSLVYLTRRKRFRGNVTGLAAVSAVLALRRR
jgi:hypothetical protein